MQHPVGGAVTGRHKVLLLVNCLIHMCCELLDCDISMIIQVLKRPGAIVAAYSINLPVETPMGDLEENIYQVILICCLPLG